MWNCDLIPKFWKVQIYYLSHFFLNCVMFQIPIKGPTRFKFSNSHNVWKLQMFWNWQSVKHKGENKRTQTMYIFGRPKYMHVFHIFFFKIVSCSKYKLELYFWIYRNFQNNSIWKTDPGSSPTQTFVLSDLLIVE